MTGYLLIESRDPFESNDVHNVLDLALGLSQEGQDVTLFLVQNGVLAARSGAVTNGLARLAEDGVDVLVDEFSLMERGISHNRLVAGVRTAPLDIVVDLLDGGRKALWH